MDFDGDTLIHELDRLGRSMVEMLVQVNGLIERGVAIKTLDGRLDTASMRTGEVGGGRNGLRRRDGTEVHQETHRRRQGSRQEQRSEVRTETPTRPSKQQQSWKCVSGAMDTEPLLPLWE